MEQRTIGTIVMVWKDVHSKAFEHIRYYCEIRPVIDTNKTGVHFPITNRRKPNLRQVGVLKILRMFVCQFSQNLSLNGPNFWLGVLGSCSLCTKRQQLTNVFTINTQSLLGKVTYCRQRVNKGLCNSSRVQLSNTILASVIRE